LHPDLAGFEYGSPIPGHPFVSPHRFWRMQEERGILLHTFFGLPLLMDLAMVHDNHAECLDRDLLENIYFSENFGHSEHIRIIQDSDEFCVISLTPAATNVLSLPVLTSHPLGLKQEYDQLRNIRESMWYYVGRTHDIVRRALFGLPIRWHTLDLDDDWMKEERRIDQLINCVVGDYYEISRPPNKNCLPSKYDPSFRVLLTDAPLKLRVLVFKMSLIEPLSAWINNIAKNIVFVIKIISRRVGLALIGDSTALRWWGWRLRKFGSDVIGRPFQEPKPPTP